MADRKQCVGCDYFKGLYGGAPVPDRYCDYYGETVQRKPDDVDGVCPARKTDKKRRRNFNPLPGKEGEYIEVGSKGSGQT